MEKEVTMNVGENLKDVNVIKDPRVANIIKKGEGLAQVIGDEFLPGNFNPFEKLRRGNNRSSLMRENSEYEERVIDIKRVIKVTKGGRRFKFAALVVVGDKKGRIGFSSAKHIEVPEAIKKASRRAKNNLVDIKIVGSQATISHEYIGHHGAAKVLLKPAREGKGIIASDKIRAVVELAGIRNIYSKNLGTNNPQAVILATLDALLNQRTKKEIMNLRNFEQINRRNFKTTNNNNNFNNNNNTFKRNERNDADIKIEVKEPIEKIEIKKVKTESKGEQDGIK